MFVRMSVFCMCAAVIACRPTCNLFFFSLTARLARRHTLCKALGSHHRRCEGVPCMCTCLYHSLFHLPADRYVSISLCSISMFTEFTQKPWTSPYVSLHISHTAVDIRLESSKAVYDCFEACPSSSAAMVACDVTMQAFAMSYHRLSESSLLYAVTHAFHRLEPQPSSSMHPTPFAHRKRRTRRSRSKQKQSEDCSRPAHRSVAWLHLYLSCEKPRCCRIAPSHLCLP